MLTGAVLAACGNTGLSIVAENPTPDPITGPSTPCEAPTCQVVELELGDFTIVPSRIFIDSPLARFVLTNTGSFTHAFQVESAGQGGRSINIGPDQTGFLTVELTHGEHSVVCPIRGHAVRGQRATITVDAG